MTSVVIIDYGSGNLRSVARALMAVSENDKIEISAAPEKIKSAARLVLPGVGAFEACRAGLGACRGRIEALEEAVRQHQTPFLGICVGMQLMAERGREYGASAGLGWVQGEAVRLQPAQENFCLPHMGWNNLRLTQKHFLFDDMDGANVYFAHSFALSGLDENNIVALSDYGASFPAGIVCHNMAGVQFHPEKSQRVGLGFLRRFLSWQP